jgi:hypothetical protein
LADYIINVAGFEFSTGTGSEIAPHNSRSRVASGAIGSLSGRGGRALALRLPIQHLVRRHIGHPLGVTLALQAVGDRVAGNVGRGGVVINLQVAARVDRSQSKISALTPALS